MSVEEPKTNDAQERLEKIKASKRKYWHSEKGRAALLRRKLKQHAEESKEPV